jgi:ABC-type glycerol-3-phosphate transport system permease component
MDTPMQTQAQVPTALQLKKRRINITLTGLTMTVFFLILAFLFLIPLYWMGLSSLRPNERIFTSGTNPFPQEAYFDNYTRLFDETPYQTWFKNSVIQSLGYSIVTVSVCTAGGFALAKYRFPFRNVIFILILFAQMVPFHLLLVSLFVMIIDLNLVDTLKGAILPLAAHPIGIFFMRQYMLSLEDDMLDAARVDGASEYGLFLRVVLPNVRPAIATLLILFALEYWNNLLWPLIVFRTPENMPLAVGLSTLVNQYFSAFDLVMAGSVLATLPIVILFLFLRRQFMEGFAATGTGIK